MNDNDRAKRLTIRLRFLQIIEQISEYLSFIVSVIDYKNTAVELSSKKEEIDFYNNGTL